VWNAATGDPINAYQTGDPFKAYQSRVIIDQDEVLHVSWSPNGQRLAASDKDGKIWVGSVDLPGVPT
jgi:WD40 repeat protein